MTETLGYNVVFPAHAGMIPIMRKSSNTAESVPRACGDDPITLFLSRASETCSPRMRG